MTRSCLRHRRILVVEDEYLLADELRTELEALDAMVIGPVGRLSQALALVAATRDIDGALLDVHLQGELVYPVAQSLRERHVPILFVTGYDASVIPPAFRDLPRCEKPLGIRHITERLAEVLEDQ